MEEMVLGAHLDRISNIYHYEGASRDLESLLKSTKVDGLKCLDSMSKIDLQELKIPHKLTLI